MILDKNLYAQKLRSYYLDHFGESESDIWYEQPAVNVWVFGRNGKIITLKSNVLTGEVTDISGEKI